MNPPDKYPWKKSSETFSRRENLRFSRDLCSRDRIREIFLVGIAVVTLGFAAPSRATAAESSTAAADREAFFESSVRPLLVAKCHACHGEAIAEAGLRLDSRRSLLAGGDSGAVVVPGDAGESRLLAAVRRSGNLAMPPDESLTAGEISTLEAWVADGVPWSGPGGDAADGASSGQHPDIEARLSAARASHWAFQPPTRHDPPALPATLAPAVAAAWSRSRIDRFVAARLATDGFSPSPEATPRELARRLWFDLTGLPPPADEVDAFCRECERERSASLQDGPARSVDDAVASLADRLLESREHAEHWARKWLDLARFADTIGYRLDEQDHRHPFAWTYRDWVVDALARDLPYDRFVVMQLAADRIEPPVPPRDLAALGFLTCGRTFLGNGNDIIDDAIDLVTRGLMGLTVSCARCHDHKYEPISTADYYALHGIFASCRRPDELPVIGEGAPGPEADAFARKLQELRTAVAEHERAVHRRATRDAVAHAAEYFLETARPTPRDADKRPPRLADGYVLEQLMLDRLSRLLGKSDPRHPVLGPWLAVCNKKDAEIAAAIREIVAHHNASAAAVEGNAFLNPLVLAALRSSPPTTLPELARVYAGLATRAAPESAGGPPRLADDPPEVVSLRAVLGEEGTPLVVTAGEAMRVADRAEETEHRRRKRRIAAHLAESPGGPPRAMAVLDGTPTDSPVLLRGDPARPGAIVPRRLPMLLGGGPVDRESSGRLDLAHAIVSADNPLAARMVVNWAWMHHMGRGIVGTPDDLGLRGDAPDDPHLLDDLARRFVEEGRWSLRWLHREIVTSRAWRQSSAIRADLSARDPENRLCGRANRRRLDWEAWRDSLLVAAGTLDTARRGGPGIDPLDTKHMDHRSIYGWLDRQDVPGMLRAFDVASPDTSVHARTPTLVPQQSLAVLNSRLVVEAARRIAARVERESPVEADAAGRVTRLWRAVLSRSPSAEERDAALGWLAREARAEPSRPADDARKATANESFGPWERLAQAVVATAEFQFID